MSLLILANLFSKLAQRTERSHQPTRSRQPTINYYDDPGEEIESKRITDTMIIHAARKFGLDIRLLDAIGQGRYSKAFLYKNHVVKFTLSHFDVNALLRLDALRGRLKNDKHLLRIFNVEHDPDTGLYMIEVERLEPLSPHVKDMLFSAPVSRPLEHETPRKLFEILKNEHLVRRLLDMAMNELDSETKQALYPFRHRLYSLVMAHFNQVARTAKTTLTVSNFIPKLLADTKRYVSDLLPDVEYNDLGVFFRELWEPLSLVLIQRFPRDLERMDPITQMQYSTLPESRSVVEFLEELKHMGVNWKDLHGANLMQRPGSDKTIVISDPGLFEFSDS